MFLGYVPSTLSDVIFKTNFQEYLTGSAPSDWTPQDVSGGSGSIVTASGSLSGKAFLFTNLNSGSGRITYSWNRAPSSFFPNVEVLVRGRQFSASGDTKPITGIFCRGSGPGINSYYRMETRYRTASSFDTLVQMINSSGVINQTDGPAPLYSGTAPTPWLWNRLRVNGTTVQVRSWQDGQSEPGTWLMTATDSSVTSGGLAGIIFTATSGVPTIQIDFFSVGLNGFSAPGP